MPKAFISYARDGSHGENLAVEIQQQLQTAGFDVFRDVTGLKPGDVWFHKLDGELESSDVMVLVLSEKVRTSTWVPNEVDLAKELGIPIIPVLAEKMLRPTWVRHLQVLDFCGMPDWQALLMAIGHHVRNVSATEETVEEVVIGRYIIHNNGTVADTETGLMWKRCSEGQGGTDCDGEPIQYAWDDAMSKFGKGVGFAGYNDWRMPTIEELRTLVDEAWRPTINLQAFPNTSYVAFWSSSPNDQDGDFAWYVYFGTGYDGGSKYNAFQVRLVRSGQ